MRCLWPGACHNDASGPESCFVQRAPVIKLFIAAAGVSWIPRWISCGWFPLANQPVPRDQVLSIVPIHNHHHHVSANIISPDQSTSEKSLSTPSMHHTFGPTDIAFKTGNHQLDDKKKNTANNRERSPLEETMKQQEKEIRKCMRKARKLESSTDGPLAGVQCKPSC